MVILTIKKLLNLNFPHFFGLLFFCQKVWELQMTQILPKSEGNYKLKDSQKQNSAGIFKLCFSISYIFCDEAEWAADCRFGEVCIVIVVDEAG